jgi:hypothetical protein
MDMNVEALRLENRRLKDLNDSLLDGQCAGKVAPPDNIIVEVYRQRNESLKRENDEILAAIKTHDDEIIKEIEGSNEVGNEILTEREESLPGAVPATADGDNSVREDETKNPALPLSETVPSISTSSQKYTNEDVKTPASENGHEDAGQGELCDERRKRKRILVL